MSFADKIRAKGFSLADCKFIKLAVCCFVVAIEEKLTPSLFSELAALLLVCRLVYPLPYALDVDLVRTQVWLTGLYATIMVAACAMYPETTQPLFA